MKKIIIIIFLSTSTNLFAQDVDMVDFVNRYRIANGKDVLNTSKELTKIAIAQTKVNVNQDSLTHSHLINEIATMGHSLPTTAVSKDNFTKFLINTFKIKYVEPKTEFEVVKYTKLYAMYLFDKSPVHKKILLGDYNTIGLDIVIKDIKHKTNVIIIGGKIFEYNKMINHYEVKFYSVITLK